MAEGKKIIIPLGNNTPTNKHLLHILQKLAGDRFEINDYLKDECTPDDCQNIYDEINQIDELKDQIIFVTLPDKSFQGEGVRSFSSFMKELNIPENSTQNPPENLSV